MKDSYQGPNEGFRLEVKIAATRELVAFSHSVFGHTKTLACPSCGKEWQASEETAEEHAEGCADLRGDIADGM